MPKVSIVITCYNYGRYVRQAISSAQNQTCHDIEVITVDDGSTDPDTIAETGRLEAEGCTIIRQPNGGVSSARNTGIAAASGEFILMLDADNYLFPNAVERLLPALERDSRVCIAYGDALLCGAGKGIWRQPEFDMTEMLLHNQIDVCALFRRADWERCGGFDSQANGLEDYDFWLSILETGETAVHIPETVFAYRKHQVRSTSVSGKTTKNSRAELKKYIVNKHRALYEEHFDELLEYAMDGLRLRQEKSVLKFDMGKRRFKLSVRRK